MPIASVDDIELYYDTFGDPTDPTVLLVPGLGAQCVNYEDAFCSQIVEDGHHVVRFDNRDVGCSTHLDGVVADPFTAVTAAASGMPVDAPYDLGDMAADAVGLLDVLGIETVHVAGTSMGGMISQTIAIEHPERVRSLTSIMSTTGEVDVGNPQPEILGPLLSIMAEQPTRKARIDNGVELARLIGSPDAFDEEWVRERTARFVDRSYDPDGTARQLVAVMASGSRVEGLSALSLPTMVLHGDRDPLIDISGGRRTAELVPSAEFRLLDGMGHDMPREYWDRLIAGIVDNAALAVEAS